MIKAARKEPLGSGLWGDFVVMLEGIFGNCFVIFWLMVDGEFLRNVEAVVRILRIFEIFIFIKILLEFH